MKIWLIASGSRKGCIGKDGVGKEGETIWQKLNI